MFTLIDEHNIKHDNEGIIFNKRDDLYDLYVSWCDQGGVPSVDRPDIYEAVLGKLKDRDCYFCRRSTAGQTIMENNQSINIKRRRGQLISELCAAVLGYVTGKNDQDNLPPADIDAMIAAHGDVLQALQTNRHNTAKTLIQGKTPDQYITQADIDNVLAIYDRYESKINALV